MTDLSTSITVDIDPSDPDFIKTVDKLMSSFTIVTPTTRMLGDTREDKQASAELAAAKGTTTRHARVRKTLFAETPEYHDLVKVIRGGRSFVKDNAEKYGDGYGNGFLYGPQRLMTTLIPTVAAIRREVDTKKAAFEAVYDQAVQDNLQAQGALADPSVYPPKSEAIDSFGFDVRMEPASSLSGWDNVSIPPNVAAKLAGMQARRCVEDINNVIERIQGRLTSHLTSMVTVLEKKVAGEKTRLSNSVINNLTAMAGVVEDLHNGTRDQRLADLHTQLQGMLVYSRDELSENAGAATEVANKARAVLGAHAPPAFTGTAQAPTPAPVQPDPIDPVLETMAGPEATEVFEAVAAAESALSEAPVAAEAASQDDFDYGALEPNWYE